MMEAQMPINVSWGNLEKTVVYTEFVENWTLEDNHNMIDAMYALNSSVSHTVHNILDFTRSTSSPARLLTSGNHIEKRSVSNTGISVIVKANGFVKAMAQLIMKMFVSNQKLYFVDTLAEAYDIIAQHEQAETSG
jgi:hypothetical protein